MGRDNIMLKKAYLEISNICNLSCRFCPGTKREARIMTPAEFRILAVRLRKHTEYLYLHLMGEPLLHPQLEELLSIAAELGFKVIITTNGTLLPERGALLLQSAAVHKVNVSLQSFEGNGGDEPEDYLRACENFAAAAGESGKLCVLRLWNSGGFETLNPRMRAELARRFPQPWEKFRRSLRLAPRVFLEPGDMFDWPDMSAEELGENCFCYGLRDQVGVLCDGTVVPCCLDHDGDIPLGNLFERELDEILASPRAGAIREGFSRRRAVEELCRRCGYARRF